MEEEEEGKKYSDREVKAAFMYISQEVEKEFSKAPKEFGKNYAAALGTARGFIDGIIKDPELFEMFAKKKLKEVVD